jgi:hypothetical protein
MNVSAMASSGAMAQATVRLEPQAARPSGLWSSLAMAWTRRLDRRVEEDLCWLGHSGVLEDFQRASCG